MLGAGFLLLFTSAVPAENAQVMLTFGGDPGSPLAYAYTSALPEDDVSTYTLRIPVTNRHVATVFHDTLLTISAPGRIVQSVTAARAYRTIDDCHAARATISTELNNTLTQDYASEDNAWQRQSADGKVVGRVVCEQRRYEPMPVLRLRLEAR